MKQPYTSIRNRPMLALALVSALGLCIALCLYWFINPGIDEPPQAVNDAVSINEKMRQTLEHPAVVARLKARLDRQPSDGDGWWLLARSQAQIGQYGESVQAYRQVVRLKPSDAFLLAEFADVLAIHNGAQFAGEPNALLKQALVLDPDNPPALSLSGLAALDRRDLAAAVDHWEHLLRVVPSTSPYAEQARQGIASVRAPSKAMVSAR